ncbi:MAG TPA: hypothetical protein DIS75_06430 [Chryseobacterium sp.]|nr:hypothetical protein [Chryseobacterium sp.]
MSFLDKIEICSKGSNSKDFSLSSSIRKDLKKWVELRGFGAAALPPRQKNLYHKKERSLRTK